MEELLTYRYRIGTFDTVKKQLTFKKSSMSNNRKRKPFFIKCLPLRSILWTVFIILLMYLFALKATNTYIEPYGKNIFSPKFRNANDDAFKYNLIKPKDRLLMNEEHEIYESKQSHLGVTFMVLLGLKHGQYDVLLGNVGMHAYNGNPVDKGDEEILRLHYKMVNEVSDLIAPSTEDAWRKLESLLHVHLSPVEIEGLKCIQDVFKKLMEKGIIAVGNYVKFKDTLSDANLIQCREKVEEYENLILMKKSSKGEEVASMKQLQNLLSGLFDSDQSLATLSSTVTEEDTSPQELVVPSSVEAIDDKPVPKSRISTDVSKEKSPTDTMNQKVYEWKVMDQFCYITKGVKAVQEHITSMHVQYLTVTGTRGSGKSTAVRHAALHLQTTDGFSIYPIDEPAKFKKYFNRNIKQVFVFENPIGIASIDTKRLQAWDSYNENMKKCLRMTKNTKILISMRSELFDFLNRRKSLIFNEEHHKINFTNQKFLLNTNDCKGILQNNLRMLNTESKLDDDACKILLELFPYSEVDDTMDSTHLGHCTPLICRVYSEIASTLTISKIESFESPYLVFTCLFQEIKKRSKHQFCGLMLCAIFNCKKNNTDPFCDNIDPESEEVRKTVLKSLDINMTELQTIKQKLMSLVGSYVSYSENTFTFTHTIMQDIVLQLYDDPSFIFKYGTDRFIRERVRINNKFPEDDEFVLVFKGDENFEWLANRLATDLKCDPEDGSFFIAENLYIDNPKFLSYLESKLFKAGDENITKNIVNILFKRCVISMENKCNIPKNNNEEAFPLYQFARLLIQNGADCNINLKRFYPLQVSVLTGNMQLTKLLLHNGANEHLVFNDICILHVACVARYNSKKLLKLFLKRSSFTENPNFPLLHAVTLMKTDSALMIAKLLMKHNYPINTLDVACRSILHHIACYMPGGYKTEQLIKFALKNGCNVNCIDVFGRSELHYIGMNNSDGMFLLAQLLVELGCSASIIDISGKSALHYIAESGAKDITKVAKLFITSGCCINHVDNAGRTVLYYAIKNAHVSRVELVKLLLEHHCNFTVDERQRRSAMHLVIKYGYLEAFELAKLLVDHHFPTNAVDIKGRSVIHYVFLYMSGKDSNTKPLVNMLLQNGYSLTTTDNRGMSALNYFIKFSDEKDSELFDMLIKHGCSLNTTDNGGRTVLHYIARFMRSTEDTKEILDKLIDEHDCPVNVLDKHGRSILHNVCMNENEKLFQLAEMFIDKGCCVINKDNTGKSVLHYVAMWINYIEESSKLIKLFLENGCSVNDVDYDGNTVQHYAINCDDGTDGHQTMKLIECLAQYDCNFQTLNNNGESLLHYTAMFMPCGSNTEALLDLLIRHRCSVNDVDHTGQSVLHKAVRNKCGVTKNLADLFIKKGSSVNVKDNRGKNILHEVMMFGGEDMIEVVDTALDKGCSVNSIDCEGKNILSYIVKYSNEDDEGSETLKLFEKLIDRGSTVNVDNKGRSLLHVVARYMPGGVYTEKLIRLLIEKHNCNINAVDHKGKTVLHHISMNDCGKTLQLAKFLIKEGCDINQKDNKGKHMIYYVVRNSERKSLQLAKLCIKHRCNMSEISDKGKSILNYAILFRNRKVLGLAKLFIKHGCPVENVDEEGRSLLHYVSMYLPAEKKTTKLVNLLIQNGCTVEALDVRGRSLLHCAAMNINGEPVHIAKLLMKYGCKIDQTDKTGRSVLHYVATNNSCGIRRLTKYFIRKGCSVNATDNSGESVIHSLVRHGNEIHDIFTIMKLLVENGCNIYTTDQNGLSVMHYAAKYLSDVSKIQTVVEYFIEHNCSIHCRDIKGRSILHYVAKRRQTDKLRLMKFLLETGCSANTTDLSGKSVLHFVIKYGDNESVQVAQLLIRYGCSVTAHDKTNKTVLHYVAKYAVCNIQQLIELFLKFGCSIDTLDVTERNALHYVIERRDNIDVIKCFCNLANVSCLNVHDCNLRSPFWYVVNNKIPEWSRYSSCDREISNREEIIEFYKSMPFVFE